MAYGTNDKRGATNSDNSTHTGNNHHIVTVSAPSLITHTPNHHPHSSGIVHSFNNYKKGKQDFSRAEIKSTVTGDSFNNHGSGSQTFREAQIRCAEKSTKQSGSLFPFKRDHVASYGSLHSFNNKGKGSQCFDGFKLN